MEIRNLLHELVQRDYNKFLSQMWDRPGGEANYPIHLCIWNRACWYILDPALCLLETLKMSSTNLTFTYWGFTNIFTVYWTNTDLSLFFVIESRLILSLRVKVHKIVTEQESLLFLESLYEICYVNWHQ